jgi:hypothetical protein
MAIIHLSGHITKDRKLMVTLPQDVPAGDVLVTIELATDWTDEEIQAWMSRTPAANGAEAVAMLEAIDTSEWVDIDDPVAWVEDIQRPY